MAQIAWSRRALQDLESIADYIAQDSPAYAGAVVKNIVSQTRMLVRFPRSGRVVPELDDENIREVFAYSYRIIYRLLEDNITVTAVIHGKRILQ
jgi:plasmid stabilization system protein ParE